MKTIEETQTMLRTLRAKDQQDLGGLLKEVEHFQVELAAAHKATEENKEAVMAGVIPLMQKSLQYKTTIVSLKTRIDTYDYLLAEIEK